jgi:flagellin-like hook-associated protein FlgL
MARIGSAISGIERRLLDSLALANAQITISNLRLATGHKINSPGDNPSAFTTLSSLQSQLSSVTATLSNVTAAASMITQAQTALSGIDTLLNSIRSELLKDEDHSLTPDQRAESQAKIDEAINEINALAGTGIEGKTILAGAADYFYAGRNASQVADVLARGIVPSGTTISGSVTAAATQAELIYTGDASNQIDVTEDTTFTLTGQRGSLVVTVADEEPLSEVVNYVNQYSHDTGITAAVDEINHTLTFTSVDYGSSAIVNVEVTAGDETFMAGGENATGTNAAAEINGIAIGSSSNNVSGNRFYLNQNGFNFEIEFQPGFTGDFDTITVEGNSLTFVLNTQLSNKAALTIPSLFAANLSGPSGRLDELYTGGALAGLGDNTSQALRVVDEALGKITRVSGSVDGFYNAAISSSSTLLDDLQTNLEDHIETIDGVNDTEEELNIAYYQALADNAVSGLAIINQQRRSIVNMLQDIAGLKQT